MRRVDQVVVVIGIWSAAWRKRVGVEPTRDVERPSPDLKSGRPTGVRFFSLVRAVPAILIGSEYLGKRPHDLAPITNPSREFHRVEMLQHVDGEIASDAGVIAKLLDAETAVRRPGSELFGDGSEIAQRGAFEEPVRSDPCEAAAASRGKQKFLDLAHAGLQRLGQLVQSWRNPAGFVQHGIDTLPQCPLAGRRRGVVSRQSHHGPLAHHGAPVGQFARQGRADFGRCPQARPGEQLLFR